MTLVNADGGPAEMSGNGIRCLAWVAARAGLARGDELLVDTAAGRRLVHLERENGAVVGASRRHGPGNVRPRAHPGRRRLAVRPRSGRRRGGVPGRRSRDGKSALRPVRRRSGNCAGHDARADTRARPRASRVARTSSSWRQAGPIAWRCGCGSGEWGRRCRAAPAHAQPRPWRTAAASSASTCKSTCPGATLFVTLGDTVRLGGPVVHVFDVDVPREQLRQALARESSAGAAEPPAAAADRDRGRPRAAAPARAPRRHRLRDDVGRGGRGEPRRTRAAHRHRGRRSGRPRAPAPHAHPIRRPTSARARPRSCAASAKRSTSTS